MRLRCLRLVLALLLPVLLWGGGAAAWAADGDSHYAGFDGFLVHYKSWGKAGAPAVILVHGFTMDQSVWRHQVGPLSKAHRVIALDLPGHGQSGRPEDVDYTMSLYARAVEAVAKDAGISHAVLVGHSMGLPILHTVARRGQVKVDKLVFVDGAIAAPAADPQARAAQDKQWDELKTGVAGPDYGLVLEHLMRGLGPKLPAADLKAIIANLRDVDHRMAASTMAHFRDADVWAPARHTMPVLALYAKTSALGVKEWLAANYPKAKLQVWDDVDHFPQLEQPERVNGALLAFLK